MITYDELSIVYIATGLLSVAGTGTMVYVYSSSHRMRREYASKLIFIITLMDLLLTLKFLLSAALWRLGMRATNSSFHVFDDNWCATALSVVLRDVSHIRCGYGADPPTVCASLRPHVLYHDGSLPQRD